MGEDVGELIDCLFNDKFGLTKMQNEQGNLTLSPDLIYEKDGFLVLECDMRIPAPLQNKDVIDTVKKFPFTAQAIEKHPAVMVDKNGPFVKALSSAYSDFTGDNRAPISLGGSTFSRAFNKGVAFGPSFPNSVDNIHNANEGVSEKQLLTAFEIYKQAIINLSK
jgi:succinyl-diaminopimelate desuccinylase